MSQYKPYPAYKDSGVEWLGRVPEHWDVAPFKWHINRNDGGVWGDDPDGTNDTIVLRSTEQTVDGNWRLDDPAPRKLAAEEREFALLLSGDLLLTKSSGSSSHIGKTTLVTPEIEALKCCYSNFMQRIRTKASFSPKLAWYLMNNDLARRQFELLSNTTTGLANLNGTMVGQVLVAIPPPNEQVEILRNLDRETARIDALVDKKTRFIELLREKRQVLIIHAVTKGLDPKAKMKDSGVEWLGEVPEHWVVCKLSFRYSVELGKMLDEKKISGASLVPYLRNQDVQWDAINTDGLPKMDIHFNELERYTVQKGDLLVCEGGDVGRAAIWKGSEEVIGYQKALHRLRPHFPGKDTAEFFIFCLLAAKARGVFEESDSKATIAHLPAEKFRQYRFAFPPASEQRDVAGFLRGRLERLDTLIMKTNCSIDLLKERRSALITAAVTGQIDLRESA